MEHAYTFAVEFEDGTVIYEYEGEDHIHVWADVKKHLKKSKPVALVLIPHRDDLNLVVVKPTKTRWVPIFFRRNYRPVGHDNFVPPMTCVGFTTKYGKKESVVFVLDDGSFVVTNDRNSV